MGLLYPRLLAGQAVPMHGEYRTLVIPELTRRARTSHDAAVYVATGGNRVTEDGLRELRRLVVDLAEQSGFPGEPDRKRRAAFDLRLAALLHSTMGIVPAEAASGDMWAFLALVLLPDVAYWRYSAPPGDRILGTDLTRHVFGRLWWRAQLVYCPDDPDPYAALKILGERAFDRIYGRRRALGNSPHLVKAILRVWNGLDCRGLAEGEVLEDFLKRLLRLAPFALFECLDEQILDTELLAVAEESIDALRGASARSTQGQETELQAPSSVPEDVATEVGKPVGDASRPDEKSVHRSASPQEDSASPDESKSGDTDQNAMPADGPAPYNAYSGPGFGDPRMLGLRERAEAVTAVVAVEGPVQAMRVYRVITRLAGTRLRDTATDALVAATKYAVRKGMIAAEDQAGRTGYPGATLRMPDQPTCVLRVRGPRDAEEIPDRELAAAAKLTQAADPTDDLDLLAKRVSLFFGYERSTKRFKETLIEALRRHGR
jgi:hypothetical protein